MIVEVCIWDHDIRTYTYFDFCVDRSLHYLVEASQHLVLLLYFDLDGGFKAISKVANHS